MFFHRLIIFSYADYFLPIPIINNQYKGYTGDVFYTAYFGVYTGYCLRRIVNIDWLNSSTLYFSIV